MPIINKILTALFSLIAVSVVFSQSIQVAFDSEYRIFKLTEDIAQKIPMFSNINNFQEAQIFQLNDSTYNIEIYYKLDDRIAKITKIISKNEFYELRREVDNILKDSTLKTIALPKQEGRTLLLVSSLFHSFFQGPLFAEGLKIKGTEEITAFNLIYSSASFFIPFFGTMNKNVPISAGILHLGGSSFGLINGFLLYAGLTGKDSDKGDLYNAYLTSAVFSLFEGWLGYYIAKEYNITPGNAQMIVSIGTFGYGYGFAIGDLLGLKDNDLCLSLFLGNIAGNFAGNFLSNYQYYTYGDAIIVSNTAFLGTYAPLLICFLADVEDTKIYSLSGIVGATLGIYLGTETIKGYDFTFLQSIYSDLGTFGGYLFGSGLCYLLKTNYKTILTGGFLGSLLGFKLIYELTKNDAQVNTNSGSKLDFQLNPLGLFGSQINQRNNFSIPFLTLKYNF